MLDYFKSRADGTVSADSDIDDDFARMHEGGQQERNNEREQLLKGYGILIQTQESMQELNEQSQKIALKLKDRFKILKGNKSLEQMQNLLEKKTNSFAFKADDKRDIALNSRMISELGFHHKMKESSLIELDHNLPDLQPVMDVCFYKNKEVLVTKHATTQQHWIEENDQRGHFQVNYRRYLNIIDLKSIQKGSNSKQILIKNQLISTADESKFLLQKIWTQIDQKIYYFKINSEINQDKRGSGFSYQYTKSIQLHSYDIAKNQEKREQINFIKGEDPMELPYQPWGGMNNNIFLKEVNLIHFNEQSQSQSSIFDSLQQNVEGIMFVNEISIEDNEQEKKKIKDKPITERYVAFLHQNDNRETFYATFRKIENLNKIEGYMILKGDDSGLIGHDFQLVFHYDPKEEIFICQNLRNSQNDDINYIMDLKSQKSQENKKVNFAKLTQQLIRSINDKEDSIQENENDAGEQEQKPKEKFTFDGFKNLLKSLKYECKPKKISTKLFKSLYIKDMQNDLKNSDLIEKLIERKDDKDFKIKLINKMYNLINRSDTLRNNNLTVCTKQYQNETNDTLTGHILKSGFSLAQSQINEYNDEHHDQMMHENALLLEKFITQDHNLGTNHKHVIMIDNLSKNEYNENNFVRSTVICRSQNQIYIDFYRQLDQEQIITSEMKQSNDSRFSIGNASGWNWQNQKQQMLNKEGFKSFHIDQKIHPYLIIYNETKCNPNNTNPKEGIDFIALKARATESSDQPIDFLFSSSKINEGGNVYRQNVTIIVYESKNNHSLMEYQIRYEMDSEQKYVKQFQGKPEFIGDTAVIFNDREDKNFGQQVYEPLKGSTSDYNQVIGLKFGQYFEIPNTERQSLYSNNVYDSSFKLFEVVNDKNKKEDTNQQSKKKKPIVTGLISSNRLSQWFLDRIKSQKMEEIFDLQDLMALSLTHHETKINMVPNPDQKIQTWIENEDTQLSYLQPLQILQGQSLASLMVNFPQPIQENISYKGVNAQYTYIQKIFENEDKENNQDFNENLYKLRNSHAFQQIGIQTVNDSLLNLEMESIADICQTNRNITKNENEVHHPAIEIILEFIINTNSHLNQKLMSLVLPKLLLGESTDPNIVTMFQDYESDVSQQTVKYFAELHFNDPYLQSQIPTYFADEQYMKFQRDETQKFEFKSQQFDHKNQILTDKVSILNLAKQYKGDTQKTQRSQNYQGKVYWQELSLFNILNFALNTQKNYSYLDQYTIINMASKFKDKFPEQIQNCSRIKSIIDYNYYSKENKNSCWYYQLKIVFGWMFGIFIPFMAQLLFEEVGRYSFILITVALVFSTATVFLQMMSIYIKGFRDYIREPFNLVDLTQFIAFLSLWIIKWNVNHNYSPILHNILLHKIKNAEENQAILDKEPLCSTLSMYECHIDYWDKVIMILNSFILFTLILKFMMHLRITSQVRLQVILILNVITGIVPILLIWFALIIFFALQAYILGTDTSQARSYSGVSRSIGMFFQSFENGLGPILPPTMSYWTKHKNEYMVPIIMHLVWFFWILQQVILLIVLINFVVAAINDQYQDVMNNKDRWNYQLIQELNDDQQTFYQFYLIVKEFVLNINKKSTDKKVNYTIDNLALLIDTTMEKDDEWKGVVKTLKTCVQKQNRDIKQKIHDQDQQIQDACKKVDSIFFKIQGLIDKSKDQGQPAG